MYVLRFHSLLPHSITTIIIFFLIIITSSPPLNGQVLDQFSTCNNSLYTCGEEIKNIGYPFWGGDRPKVCGHPLFQLTCDDNTNYTTMILNSQSFRVIHIDNPTKYLMNIARSDLLDDVCPSRSNTETRLIDGLFVYLDVENVTLHFDCSSSFNMSQNYSRFELKCNEDGVEKLGFFADDTVPSSVRDEYENSCEFKIEVPISEIGLKELKQNPSREFLKVLNQGISVGYNGSFEYCFACEKSDGICWSGTSLEEPTCLCGDGIYPYYCGFKGGKSKVILKMAIGIGASVFWLVLICAVLFVYCRRKKRYPYGTEFGRQGSGNGWGCNAGIYKKSLQRGKEEHRNLDVFMEQYGSLAPVVYTYSDIKKMTSSFKHKLGQGGFGEVYKGMLYDGRIVAVKILNSTNENGEDFINEVVSISRTSHVNVVNLLGFCYRGTKRALVYEFMPNGSLERYIHGNNNTHLGWDKLYEIALGIARGLEYLHKGCNTRIVHFDIKPHNILLDQDFCPKISDFGLAKLCANKESTISMFGARGTIGYIAPEVVSRNFGSVSHKSDVYSYGMMVLEMVGGRKNVNDNVSHSSAIYFPHWAYQRLLLEEDLKLQGVIKEEEEEIAKKMILIGFWCIQTDPSDRPSMNKVIEMLEGSLEKLEMPPKPFLYSSSHSEDISQAISPIVLPLHSSSSSCTISMNIA